MAQSSELLAVSLTDYKYKAEEADVTIQAAKVKQQLKEAGEIYSTS